MPAPIVSVLMPVYNTARFVQQAVNSILEQTLRNFELIIVDDGSSDASPQILSKLAAVDNRISLRRQGNRGPAATRNRLVSLAQSNLLAFMDSDDAALPGRLQAQVSFMDAHPECVVVGTRMLAVCEEGLPLFLLDQPTEHQQIEQLLLRGVGTALGQPSAMVRRPALEAVGGYRERYCVGEDLDLFLRLALAGRLANLPQVYLHYCQHLGSIMHSFPPEQAALVHEMLIEAHRARGLTPPTVPPAYMVGSRSRCEYLQRWGWNALKLGEKWAARRYALRGLREEPLRLLSWRLVLCAMRGH